jgi:hypothetical protein
MKKLLLRGTTGALLEVCNTSTKYELVSAWGYDETTGEWAQGHYFTLWYDITEENKKKLYERAKKHFVEHYL